MRIWIVALLALGLATAAQSQQPERKRIKLAGITMQEDQFFRLVLFGMRDAARKAGVELFEGDTYHQPEKEIELVQTYVSRKVDAILISPLSKKGSVAALKLAHDKGVCIVSYNTPVDADFLTAAIESSDANLGQQTGKAAREYIGRRLGGKAKLAIVAFKSANPEQSAARVGGFKSEIARLPGVEIVAEQDAWLTEMAVKRVGDILTAHPDVDVIWSANEGGTTGSVLAVKDAGKAGHVVVFGTDASEQLLAMLQSDDNILQAITSQRPVEIGRLAVEAALKSLKGEPTAKETVLPGVLLSRADPSGVKKFATDFKAWTSQGTR
jgi:simple sugar transport system substrate-binding protein/ribose transport system substrate-binding protein